MKLDGKSELLIVLLTSNNKIEACAVFGFFSSPGFKTVAVNVVLMHDHPN